jgi:hypothetical protein
MPGGACPRRIVALVRRSVNLGFSQPLNYVSIERLAERETINE